MARLDLNALTLWITAAAIQHPHALVDHVAQRLEVTKRTARRALSRLVELRWLERGGTRCRLTYQPGLLRQVVHRYPLRGLQEHVPWSRDFAPFFALSPEVRRMAQHAFCELVNNAVDHSEGTGVTVSMRQTPSQLQLLVSDDGRGLFDKLRETFGLDDPSLAMLELSKGRLTSQPDRHTGRGLFFTARVADVLDVRIRQARDPVKANARGAAFIAAVGRGLMRFEDVPDRIAIGRTYEPRRANRQLYDDLFGTFTELHKRLAPVYRRLNGRKEAVDG